MSDKTEFPQIVFFGRIHPTEQALTVELNHRFHVIEPNRIPGMPDVESTFLIEINDGKFTCNISPEFLENSGDTGLHKIKHTVNQIVGQILDSVNFVTDTQLEGEAEKCLLDGEPLIYFTSQRLGLDVIEDFRSSSDVQDYAYRMLSLKNGLHLRHALADFRRARKYPGETAMHCFRSIESIRQHFAPGTDSRRQSWGRMREVLNLGDDWLRQFEADAIAQRHGELVALRGTEVKQMLETTWLTIKRFADYLLGEKVVELPMLDSADVTNA